MDRVACRGFLNTQSVVKYQRNGRGDPLEGKKVSQCRKTERGDPLGFFIIHFVAKHQKIEGGIFFKFGEKNLTVLKKFQRGDPLGFSNIHSDAKQQKN